MKTLLLYNPHAGRNRHIRDLLVGKVVACLSHNGFVVTVEATQAAGSGGAQARQAIENGYEAVFACGGDGTIHDVLQGVVGTNIAFGILPFGSANALARELGIRRNPVHAASAYLPDRIHPVRIGVVRRSDEPNRYFLSMAGAGPDGALMYRMLTVDRSRMGRLSYYVHAARLFFTTNFSEFNVTYAGGDGEQVTKTAIAVLLLRVGRLGGLFSGVARGASLRAPEMHMLIVHPPGWLSLPLWFVCSWTRTSGLNPWLTIARTNHARIEPLDGPERIHMQADGEWLGRGSCAVQLLEQTVNILVTGKPR